MTLKTSRQFIDEGRLLRGCKNNLLSLFLIHLELRLAMTKCGMNGAPCDAPSQKVLKEVQCL